MLDLYLMQFSKRENSTLIPTAAQIEAITPVQVSLKGGCDILNPTFILNSENIPAGNNYAKFQDRYYFITGISSVRNNLVEITARVDVLGSWKAAILTGTYTILFETNGNNNIVDGRLATKYGQTWRRTVASLGDLILFDGGATCISVTGVNGCTNYVISYGAIKDLMHDIETWYAAKYPVTQISDIGQNVYNVAKNLFTNGSAMESLRAAWWLPIVWPTETTGNSEKITLGLYDTDIDGLPITTELFTSTASVQIPWQFNDWRNTTPYTRIYLYLPLIGTVQLSPSELIGENTLTVNYAIHLISGDVSVEVLANAKSISIYSTNIRSELPFGSSGITGKQGANFVSGMLAGAAALGMGIGAQSAKMIGGGLAAMGASALNSLQPISLGGGGAGGSSAAALTKFIQCMTCCHDTANSPDSIAETMGIPSGRTGVLQLGFVQTENASVSGNMLDPERDMINKMLDRGIYIE